MLRRLAGPFFSPRFLALPVSIVRRRPVRAPSTVRLKVLPFFALLVTSYVFKWVDRCSIFPPAPFPRCSLAQYTPTARPLAPLRAREAPVISHTTGSMRHPVCASRRLGAASTAAGRELDGFTSPDGQPLCCALCRSRHLAASVGLPSQLPPAMPAAGTAEPFFPRPRGEPANRCPSQ